MQDCISIPINSLEKNNYGVNAHKEELWWNCFSIALREICMMNFNNYHTNKKTNNQTNQNNKNPYYPTTTATTVPQQTIQWETL